MPGVEAISRAGASLLQQRRGHVCLDAVVQAAGQQGPAEAAELLTYERDAEVLAALDD